MPQQKRKERVEREYGTYDALDEKYIQYLTLSLQYPDLDVGEYPTVVENLSPEQRMREIAMMSILMSILKRAYIMYSDKSNKKKEEEWTGWDEYIHGWYTRDSFKRNWKYVGQEFQSGFMKYISDVVASQEEMPDYFKEFIAEVYPSAKQSRTPGVNR
jgi:hypothetical protein